jgi:hypothetical protein
MEDGMYLRTVREKFSSIVGSLWYQVPVLVMSQGEQNGTLEVWTNGNKRKQRTLGWNNNGMKTRVCRHEYELCPAWTIGSSQPRAVRD